MSDSKSGFTIPSPDQITYPLLERLVQHYPKVLADVYRARLLSKAKSKVDSQKRYGEAIDDDRWRYEEFPKLVNGRGEEAGLRKEELERLVRWKVTHGKFRPFLLPMIRKNSPDLVATTTKTVFSSLPSSPSKSAVLASIKALNAIKGAGPATATLLLSVIAPNNVPFFQDESFEWLCRDKGGNEKLKYDVKEYSDLFEKVSALKKRLESETGESVPVWMIEQAGFVIGNAGVLGPKSFNANISDGSAKIPNRTKSEGQDEDRGKEGGRKRRRKEKDEDTRSNANPVAQDSPESKSDQQAPVKKRRRQ